MDLEEDLLLREANSLLNKYATQQVDQEYANSSAYVLATNGAERNVDLASIYAGQGELSPKELLSLARYFSEHSISKNTIDAQNFEDIFTAAGIAIDDEFEAKVKSFKDIIIQASEEFYDIVA